MSEVVSLLEFARRQNVQMTTIKKYVTKGKIHGPAIELSAGGKPKLKYDIALMQYNEARKNVAHRFARSGHTLDKPASAEPAPAPLFEPEPEPEAEPGKLTARQSAQMDNLLALGSMSEFDRAEKLRAFTEGEYDLPDTPVVHALLKEAGIKRARVTKTEGPRRPQGHGGNLKTGADKIDADVSEISDFSQAALSELELPALTKLEAVLRVRKAQVDLQEKEGRLVDVGQARNALFAAAQEIKNRIEGIPDRIIDEVLAAKNRNEAFLVLRAEINSALNELADLPATQLSNKRKIAAVPAE